MTQNTTEIRWHGRGGQGTITAARITAKAALQAGYRGVVMVPSFGTERRGAPVLTSLKISKEKIYDLSDIEYPDIIVVLDHSLLNDTDVVGGLRPGGVLIINTSKPPTAYRYDGVKVATADVAAISAEAGLPYGTISTGIIGAFEKAVSLVGMDILTNTIKEEFNGKKPEENARAAILSHERTFCLEIDYGN